MSFIIQVQVFVSSWHQMLAKVLYTYSLINLHPGSASSIPALWHSNRFNTAVFRAIWHRLIHILNFMLAMLLILETPLCHFFFFPNLNNTANVISYSPTTGWLRSTSLSSGVCHLAIQAQNSRHKHTDFTAFHTFFWTAGVVSLIITIKSHYEHRLLPSRHGSHNGSMSQN